MEHCPMHFLNVYRPLTPMRTTISGTLTVEATADFRLIDLCHDHPHSSNLHTLSGSQWHPALLPWLRRFNSEFLSE